MFYNTRTTVLPSFTTALISSGMGVITRIQHMSMKATVISIVLDCSHIAAGLLQRVMSHHGVPVTWLLLWVRISCSEVIHAVSVVVSWVSLRRKLTFIMEILYNIHNYKGHMITAVVSSICWCTANNFAMATLETLFFNFVEYDIVI